MAVNWKNYSGYYESAYNPPEREAPPLSRLARIAGVTAIGAVSAAGFSRSTIGSRFLKTIVPRAVPALSSLVEVARSYARGTPRTFAEAMALKEKQPAMSYIEGVVNAYRSTSKHIETSESNLLRASAFRDAMKSHLGEIDDSLFRPEVKTTLLEAVQSSQYKPAMDASTMMQAFVESKHTLQQEAVKQHTEILQGAINRARTAYPGYEEAERLSQATEGLLGSVLTTIHENRTGFKDRVLSNALQFFGLKRMTLGELTQSEQYSRLLIENKLAGVNRQDTLAFMQKVIANNNKLSEMEIDGIFKHTSTQDVVDLRGMKMGVHFENALAFLEENFHVPIVRFNPIRMLGYSGIRERRKVPLVGEIKKGDLIPFLPKDLKDEEGLVNRELLYFKTGRADVYKMLDVKSAQTLPYEFKPVSARYGQEANFLKQIFGHSLYHPHPANSSIGRTLQTFGNILDIGRQEVPSRAERFLSKFTKFANPAYEKNVIDALLKKSPEELARLNPMDKQDAALKLNSFFRKNMPVFSPKIIEALKQSSLDRKNNLYNFLTHNQISFATTDETFRSFQNLMTLAGEQEGISFLPGAGGQPLSSELKNLIGRHQKDPEAFQHIVQLAGDNKFIYGSRTKVLKAEDLIQRAITSEITARYHMDIMELSSYMGKGFKEKYSEIAAATTFMENYNAFGRSGTPNEQSLNNVVSMLQGKSPLGEEFRTALERMGRRNYPIWSEGPTRDMAQDKDWGSGGWLFVQKGKTLFDSISDINTLAKEGKGVSSLQPAREYIEQFFAGRKEPGLFRKTGEYDFSKVTSQTIAAPSVSPLSLGSPYWFANRLADLLSGQEAFQPFGLGLSHASRGSAGSIYSALIGKRIFPAVAAMSAVGYFDYELNKLTGEGLQEKFTKAFWGTQLDIAGVRDTLGLTEYAKRRKQVFPGIEYLTEMPGSPLRVVDPLGIFFWPAKSEEDMKKDMYYGGYPVRKGRFWPIGCLTDKTNIVLKGTIKSIRDVVPGDIVYNLFGDEASVVAVIPRKLNDGDKIYRIIAGGFSVEATGNHLIKACRIKKCLYPSQKKECKPKGFFGISREENLCKHCSNQHPDHKRNLALEWKRADELESLRYYVQFPKIKLEESLNCFDLFYLMKEFYTERGNDIIQRENKIIPIYYSNGKWRDIPQYIPIERYLDIDKDLGLLCGWYLAEGNLNRSQIGINGVEFSTHSKEKVDRDILRDIIFDKFHVNSFEQYHPPHCVKLRCSSIIVGLFLSQFHQSNGIKYIPAWCFSAPKAFLEGLIIGLLRGDGANLKEGPVTFKQSKKLLVQQTAVILRLFNIWGSFMSGREKVRLPNGRLFNGFIYKLSFNGIYAMRLRKMLGWKLFDSKYNYFLDTLETEDSFWVRIKTIKDITTEYHGKVWDLIVPSGSWETDSFLADGIAVHNSTPWVGEKIEYFSSHPYSTGMSRWREAENVSGGGDYYWNNFWLPTPRTPLSPIRHYLTNPYSWEQAMQKDRPYPLCLHPDTPVLTKEKYKKISDVEIGDYVINKDEKWTKVLNRSHRKCVEGKLVCIKISDDDRILRCTPDHRILVSQNEIGQCPDFSWIPAKDLLPGDLVIGHENYSLVIDVYTEEYFGEVYDLTVEEGESFLTTCIVHNSGELFAPETPWGGILNATVGRILKPTRVMHQDETLLSTGPFGNIYNSKIEQRRLNEVNLDIRRQAMFRKAVSKITPAGVMGGPFEREIPRQFANLPVTGAGAPNVQGALVPMPRGSAYDEQGGTTPGAMGVSGGTHTGRNAVRADLSLQNLASRYQFGQGELIPARDLGRSADLMNAELLTNLESPSDPLAQTKNLYYSITEQAGIFGFAAKSLTESLGGYPNPRLETAQKGYGAASRAWEQGLGGLGNDLSELWRRFLPHPQRDIPLVNQLSNTQPLWMVGSRGYEPGYFLDMTRGDPMAKISWGAGRVPGESYERLHNVKNRLGFISANILGNDKNTLVRHILKAKDYESAAGEEAMEKGEKIHHEIQQRFKKAGRLIAAEGAFTDTQLGIQGRIDAIVNLGHDIAVVEIKSANAKKFENIRTGRTPIPETHTSQLNLYMHETKQRRGFLYYINADDTNKQFVVERFFDPFMLEKDLMRAREARAEVGRMVESGTISRLELYSDLDRYRVLADISPWSESAKLYEKTLTHRFEVQGPPEGVSKEARLEWEADREEFQRIKQQKSKQTKKYELYPYKFKAAELEYMPAHITEVLDPNRFKVRELGDQILKLGGGQVLVAGEKELRKFIYPGARVTLGLDADTLRRQEDDVYSTYKATVWSESLFRSKTNVMKHLIDMGYAKESTTDYSSAGVYGRFTPAEIAQGRLWEFLSHLDSPIHSKILPTKSPVEYYQRKLLSGKSFARWQDPIGSFIEPTFESFAARSWLLGPLSGAAFGAMFGATWKGAGIGAGVGALATLSMKVANEVYEMRTGENWIPERRRKQFEIEEFFDVLEYMKNKGLYEKYRKLAEQEEGFNVNAYMAGKERAGRERQIERKRLEEEKIKLYGHKPIWDIAGVREKKLEGVNRRLNELQAFRESVSIGPYTSKALQYKEKYEGTLYGVDPYGDWLPIFRAFPSRMRELIAPFVNQTTPQERETLMKILPENQKRVIMAKWGLRDIPEKPDLMEYFSQHFLPPADWAGFDENVDLQDVKIKTMANEGVDLSDAGFYPQQLREAQSATELKPFRIAADLEKVRQNINYILKGEGLQRARINLMQSKSIDPNVKLELQFEQDHQKEIKDYINKNSFYYR